MITQRAKLAVPFAVVSVEDELGGDIPDFPGPMIVASTDSCILVGCRPDMDGETEFTLGDASAVDSGGTPIFEGHLQTPSLTVTIGTMELDTIIKAEVKATNIGVRIWANDASEPDRIIIGIF